MIDQQSSLNGYPTRTLYRLHGCPSCERIVRWLDDHDLAYRSRFVAGEHSRRDEVARISGTRSVPLLLDHEMGGNYVR
ncbi:glutaredoxin family protein (plasmid) [Haloferacaceae archaeon DSL9]